MNNYLDHCLCVCACMAGSVYVCMHVCMRVCVRGCVCMHVCVRGWVNVCMCVPTGDIIFHVGDNSKRQALCHTSTLGIAEHCQLRGHKQT